LSPSVQAAARYRAELLHPSIWRGIVSSWSFSMKDVNDSGATPVIQLGDLWGLPGRWPKVWPDEDLPAWERWVRLKAAQIAKWVPTGPVWIDVWNEPDSAGYWPISRDPALHGWMNAFAVAERSIRSVIGPRARIMGPSTVSQSSYWTATLIDYCASHGCKIDGIAWHSLTGPKTMSGLGSALRAAHARSLSDPHWRAVLGNYSRSYVPEYNPYDQRLSPGAMLAYWAQLEYGRADGAALSVWTRGGTAVDGVLDALLDIHGNPRSTWWAARAYALGRTSRVKASSSSPLTPVLASSKGSLHRREILIGDFSSAARTVSVSISGLKGRRQKFKLATYHVVGKPWLGHVSAPNWVWIPSAAIVRGTATVRFRVLRGGMVSLVLE